MGNNIVLHNALEGYLNFIGAVKKTIIPSRFSIWYDSKDNLEIMLPELEVLEHPQSNELLDEVITKLANASGVCKSNFIQKLENSNFDLLQVRSSGTLIEHGKINYKEGLNSLTGLYDIIKLSANETIKAKGKRKIINQYLDGVNMLAPQAGSFIYAVEFELIKNEDESENNQIENSISLGRCINSNLAIMLNRISKYVKSSDSTSPAKLLKYGINVSFCNNFLKLFPERSEKLEFSFDWSFKEEIESTIPSAICFDKEDRNKISTYQKLLNNTEAKRFVDLPAFIEKYSWPINEDKGKVYLKLIVNSKEHVCSIETDTELYETLKAEHAKKEIAITFDSLITSGKQTNIDVIKVYKIKLNDQDEILINT
ncbi:hypothetical protein [Photobacterium carnosum]|uniref:hypothetical protein n=1 Tax=Photobacterium carnosum TaxID=2023717 RepID=UPI001E331C27|nr:hypothetical protein [Photobacterium carnosum]MCD9498773.1 hypothetical protein [Photobacterium carnosum]